MKTKMKKLIAVICAIAMVVSSMTIYNNTVTQADDATVAADEFDPSTIADTDWTAVSNSTTMYYYIADDAGSKVTVKPQVEGNDIYTAYSLAAVFKSVTLNDSDLTPADGAYTRIPIASFNEGYNKLVVTNYYGSESVTIYFKKVVEVTTEVAGYVDGEVLLNESNNTINVPTYTGGDLWQKEYNNIGIKYIQGKKYVAEVVVSSDVDKTIKLVFQRVNIWDFVDANGGYQVTIAAGTKVKITYVFEATQSTDNGNFDIYLGSVADAATLNFESKKITTYSEVPDGVATGVEALSNTEPTQVTNLTVSSVKANTVQVGWDYVQDNTYTIELVNADDTTVQALTEFSVENGKATCEFTGVARGTYTVRATSSLNGSNAETVVSNPVQVNDVQPVNLATLETDVNTYEQIGLTWTVNNATEGQKYKVYLDGTKVAENLDVLTYTLQNVASGSHIVKVTATYGAYETEGQTRTVVVKAAPITKYSTTLTQVTTGGTQTLADSVWSYEFASQSADSHIGVSDDGAVIAYFPTYADATVDYVYETLTNLEVGKTYTYTYTVYSDITDGNNILVNATAAGDYSDGYTLTGVSSENATVVTKKFTATATEMQLKYTLGYVNNQAAIKITPATVSLVQPSDVTSVTAEGGINTINVSWVCDNAVEEQLYNIYLNDSKTPVNTGVSGTSISLDDVSEGTYTVTVKATLNGTETAGATSSSVVVTEKVAALTSDAITVEGFQIRTNGTADNVAFRTICKAPNVGSTITVNDTEYTVASMGTIYTLDTNYSGYKKYNVLNASYTILDNTAITGADYSYIGANKYNGSNRTYGYVATEGGVLSNWDSTDTSNTYYVRTLEDLTDNNMMEYTIHVRAFVVTTDGTIIYSTNAAPVSVAQIADYLYTNSKAPNYTGHKYLYNAILNKISSTNPYYRTTTIEYGWDSNLYIPDSAYILTTGTIDALNGKTN